MLYFLAFNTHCLLCVAEIDLPNEKFIIHQVKEVEVGGTSNFMINNLKFL
jgi:hypothetical protein